MSDERIIAALPQADWPETLPGAVEHLSLSRSPSGWRRSKGAISHPESVH